jgi:branched-subunit amino acid aminotransferase/4-amino-4-deoxychorismate lyase
MSRDSAALTTAPAWLDGARPTVADLTPLAFAGYAHFTAMQVREGGIRGLDLHLARLRLASEVLFGRARPDDEVRGGLRTAVQASEPDRSLTATMFESVGEFTSASDGDGLRLLVRTAPPASGPEGPLALSVVEHERPVPTVKHVGEVAKTYYLREAVTEGYDDAAFADRRGRLSEGTIWNLAFWDGSAVVWPDAEMLTGVTMAIVRRQLERLDVPQLVREVTVDDLPGLAGAVVMNSWTPGIAVRRIGPVDVPDAPDFVELLHRAYRNEPLLEP